MRVKKEINIQIGDQIKKQGKNEKILVIYKTLW